ncbi:MAG: IS4 family transposase, partial [Gammaproteobacteria bacterium]
IQAWEVEVVGPSAAIKGRLCAIRKSQEAIRLSQEAIRKKASRKGRDVKPETFEYAKYVILFTTFPKGIFSANQVLQGCKPILWQLKT